MTPWTLSECCSCVMHTHVVLLELGGGGINMDVLTCKSQSSSAAERSCKTNWLKWNLVY